MVLGIILKLSLWVILKTAATNVSIWIFGWLQDLTEAFSVSDGSLPIRSITRVHYRRVASSTAVFGGVDALNYSLDSTRY